MELKTLLNSLAVLELFTVKKNWGVREVARQLGMSVTVTHRIMSTFEKKEYLIFNEVTKLYEIGPQLEKFSSEIRHKESFSKVIKSHMKKLVSISNETIFFTMREGDVGESVLIEESSNSIRLVFDVGESRPLHAGASNQVILANLSDDEFEKYISRKLPMRTDKTIISCEALKNRRKIVKEQGGLITHGEATDNVTGIAVPIFDANVEVVGSLAIAGPSFRISSEQEQLYFTYLLDAVKNIQLYIHKYNIKKAQIRELIEEE
ncbi:IclR family transcriptional regulator [Ureibacillus manganicus]|uniref:IclR family transcriptional regulator n=1 Tax=Ureibacillus manganicus TaxID=1266064 RepID=UPI00068A0034|nr:IclR family transcriptional regulator [Ureibacillus manganicus]